MIWNPRTLGTGTVSKWLNTLRLSLTHTLVRMCVQHWSYVKELSSFVYSFLSELLSINCVNTEHSILKWFCITKSIKMDNKKTIMLEYLKNRYLIQSMRRVKNSLGFIAFIAPFSMLIMDINNQQQFPSKIAHIHLF